MVPSIPTGLYVPYNFGGLGKIGTAKKRQGQQFWNVYSVSKFGE